MNWIRLDAELFRDPRCARLPLAAKAVLVAMWQIAVEYGTPVFDEDNQPSDVEVDADRLSPEAVAAWCGSRDEVDAHVTHIKQAGLYEVVGLRATMRDLGSINAPYFKSKAYDSRRSGMRVRRNPPESVATGRDGTGRDSTGRDATPQEIAPPPSASGPATDKAPRRKASGAHAGFIDFFKTSYERHLGTAYIVTAADGVATATLLKSFTPEALQERAYRWLTSTDPWVSGTDRALKLFASKINMPELRGVATAGPATNHSRTISELRRYAEQNGITHES